VSLRAPSLREPTHGLTAMNRCWKKKGIADRGARGRMGSIVGLVREEEGSCSMPPGTAFRSRLRILLHRGGFRVEEGFLRAGRTVPRIFGG